MGGYPCWGTPPRVPPQSDLDGEWVPQGVPRWETPPWVPPIRPGWGYPNGGYPTSGTPHRTWMGNGGGTPLLQLTDGVLDTPRSVCILRSRRRTFLLVNRLKQTTALVRLGLTHTQRLCPRVRCHASCLFPTLRFYLCSARFLSAPLAKLSKHTFRLFIRCHVLTIVMCTTANASWTATIAFGDSPILNLVTSGCHWSFL